MQETQQQVQIYPEDFALQAERKPTRFRIPFFATLVAKSLATHRIDKLAYLVNARNEVKQETGNVL